MDMKTLLMKRRATRGRPRKSDVAAKTLKVVPVYVGRDPQGIKLFTSEPKLSVLGVWEGKLVNGTGPMEPRAFVLKYRNAVLPERGAKIRLDMGV